MTAIDERIMMESVRYALHKHDIASLGNPRIFGDAIDEGLGLIVRRHPEIRAVTDKMRNCDIVDNKPISDSPLKLMLHLTEMCMRNGYDNDETMRFIIVMWGYELKKYQKSGTRINMMDMQVGNMMTAASQAFTLSDGIEDKISKMQQAYEKNIENLHASYRKELNRRR